MTENCPICLQLLDDNNEIIKLDCCIAVYHKQCLHSWVLMNNTCPCCREEVLLTRNYSYYICDIIIIIIMILYIALLAWSITLLFIDFDGRDSLEIWRPLIILFSAICVFPLSLGIKRFVNEKICNKKFNIKVFDNKKYTSL